MFTDNGPRLFGLPPGADFGREIVRGLEMRMEGAPPEVWGRVTIFLNTRRMQRRLADLLSDGPPRLLPRLRLITDLATDPITADLPPAAPLLRQRFEVMELVAALLRLQPDLAPQSALFDLSASLSTLMDEMAGEGINADRIAALDVTDQSGHCDRAIRLIAATDALLHATGASPGREFRQRQAVLRLAADWAENPPAGPVLVAGSTGSRGTTALLIQAVARLPQGAVILPGFDFDLPGEIWESLSDPATAEDHPQFRFRRLLLALNLPPDRVMQWTAAPPPDPARNRLISLALRPAPATDAWMAQGPGIGDLGEATRGITLVEAPSPRAEAEAIALRLRHAVAEGLTAALITPDRTLTRQVASALARWEIAPDDSAGVPLAVTPPGRFLRQVADLWEGRITATALIALLKHPLCHGGSARGSHLRWTHELELSLRKVGPPYPDGSAIHTWVLKRFGEKPEAGVEDWAIWLASLLDLPLPPPTDLLEAYAAAHLARAEGFAAGAGQTGAGGLWDQAAGRAARALCDEILHHAHAAGQIALANYPRLFRSIMATGEVREPERGHPRVLIWGTLEARVQGADLVILGGLNEGIWPEAPPPDPWLNRALRLQAGLLLPERRIGLLAHDFQQAVAAPQVWITRSLRSADAATVPSRWLIRLTNLMAGLPDTGGPAALGAMRQRGQVWLDSAAALSQPAATVPRAARPAPQPPPEQRPKRLSVTAIIRLIRDPYAVYAQEVLRLRPLEPLNPQADAPLRGTLLHRVFEEFMKRGIPPTDPEAASALSETAFIVLNRDCPWPMVRSLWLARIERIAPRFLETEITRQQVALPALYEEWGEATVPGTDVVVFGKADRIDKSPDGQVVIYDYKSGALPTLKLQNRFDKQLLIEAAIAASGGFKALGPVEVIGAHYISLKDEVKSVAAPLDTQPPTLIWSELSRFLMRWQDPLLGYAARRALFSISDISDYDHLSRFGEWDITMPPDPQRVGE